MSEALIGWIIALVVLGFVAFASGSCSPGDAFEAACIKGRISSGEAELVGEVGVGTGDGGRRPGYCRGETYTDNAGREREGQAHCMAEPGDRILAAHCSLAAIVLGSGD